MFKKLDNKNSYKKAIGILSVLLGVHAGIFYLPKCINVIVESLKAETFVSFSNIYLMLYSILAFGGVIFSILFVITGINSMKRWVLLRKVDKSLTILFLGWNIIWIIYFIKFTSSFGRSRYFEITFGVIFILLFLINKENKLNNVS